MSVKLKTAMIALGLVLALAWAMPETSLASLRFSGRIEATSGRHLASYSEFGGIYTYQIQLQPGAYCFSFNTESPLHFELRNAHREAIVQLAPGEQRQIELARGYYKLVVTSAGTDHDSSFDITWDPE